MELPHKRPRECPVPILRDYLKDEDKLVLNHEETARALAPVAQGIPQYMMYEYLREHESDDIGFRAYIAS
jgi:hypothetical protein